MESGDTIAAISSAVGPAARMIVRLSGSQAIGISERIASALPAAGGASRVSLRARDLLFPVWLYLFRGPRSYSGEDLLEFHIPGSTVLASTLLEELLRQGARLAEPGEFTARAYFNGRIDLTEAEGVAATIAAGNEQELSAARKLLSGELARRIKPIADLLADTLALLEVGIDFSDEDVTFLPADQLATRISNADAQLDHLLTESTRFERLSHEPTVMLVGRPNAGKSTLFNALAGHQRAVVSPIAGTTRDVLSVEIPLRRGTIRLTDVAGLATAEEKGIIPFSSSRSIFQRGQENGENDVRKKGISPFSSERLSAANARVERLMREHALRAVESADVVLAVIDATDQRPPLVLPRAADWIVRTKLDLVGSSADAAQGETAVSAVTAAGMDELREVIDRLAFGQAAGGAALALNARHVRAIDEARAALQRASQITPPEAELVAMELREALDALGSIVGRISPDDLLGRIFGAFCIGK